MDLTKDDRVVRIVKSEQKSFIIQSCVHIAVCFLHWTYMIQRNDNTDLDNNNIESEKSKLDIELFYQICNMRTEAGKVGAEIQSAKSEMSSWYKMLIMASLKCNDDADLCKTNNKPVFLVVGSEKETLHLSIHLLIQRQTKLSDVGFCVLSGIQITFYERLFSHIDAFLQQ